VCANVSGKKRDFHDVCVRRRVTLFFSVCVREERLAPRVCLNVCVGAEEALLLPVYVREESLARLVCVDVGVWMVCGCGCVDESVCGWVCGCGCVDESVCGCGCVSRRETLFFSVCEREEKLAQLVCVNVCV